MFSTFSLFANSLLNCRSVFKIFWESTLEVINWLAGMIPLLGELLTGLSFLIGEYDGVGCVSLTGDMPLGLFTGVDGAETVISVKALLTKSRFSAVVAVSAISSFVFISQENKHPFPVTVTNLLATVVMPITGSACA